MYIFMVYLYREEMRKEIRGDKNEKRKKHPHCASYGN